MSIQSVVIPVPSSGDGPVADVSALTGTKTVLLSGQFRGYYDLLGSQDDVHFVAVASFDAGGVEGIRQTVAGAFKSFRLRANAVQLTPVSCEVSGVVGQNYFAVVASLPVGAGGTTPPIDTYAFAPPTGPEADISFLCTGGFRGSVVVLGSLDDVAYNPVGSFKVDRLPEGSSEALSFPPLVTQDKVRYIKLQLTGVVTSQLTVTVGGSVPSGGTVTLTLAGAYADGTVAFDQILALLDARGGGLVVDGTSPGFTGVYGLRVLASEYVSRSLAVGVDAGVPPSAHVHVAGGTAAAGTASLKVDPGALLGVRESGAVESDGVNLYWTDAALTRWPLNNASAETLAQAYAAGAVAFDQTLALLDAKGGGLVVDGTSGSFTGANALAVNAAAAGAVLFPRVGGVSVTSSVSVAAAAGASWDEAKLVSSTVTLTGAPTTVTALAMVRVGSGVVNGTGDTVSDAYDLLVDASPTGTAALTRSWSAGFAGAVQAQAGLVLGAGLNPPTEDDLVLGAGATVVSQASSGRLGYLAGGTQAFVVSANGGAYVPLLVGPVAAGFTSGSVPFGLASGQLGQDNAHFSWNATNTTLQLGGAGAVATSILALSTSKTLAAPAPGSVWDGLRVEDSTLTATMGAGNITVTELVSAHFHQPTVTTAGGAGLLTVTDAYTVRVGAPPVGAGGATLTNAWSLGVTGAVKLMSLLLVNPAAVSSGTFTGVTQVAAAHTNLTASAEVPDTNFNLSATKTWATGPITTQRDFLVQARTYAFAAASTVTTAATVAITNAPQQGANATVTNAYALWTQAGATELDGGSYVPAAGTKSQLGVTATFAPTSGTAVFNAVSLAYAVNQTGGANGTVTGLLVNATETAVVGAHNLCDLQVASVSRFKVDRYGSTTLTQTAENALVPTALTVTGGAHTAITAGTEDVGARFNFSATKNWATGDFTTQREVLFQSPRYTFVGNSTITTAATVAISGAPIAGSNATITNTLSLWIQSGFSNFNDRVGIGSGAKTPQSLLHISSNDGTVFSPTNSLAQTAACTAFVDNPQTASSRFSQLVLRVGTGSGYVRLVAVSTATDTTALAICTSNGTNPNQYVYVSPTGNVAIGAGLTPDAASTLHVVASQSVVAATGAAWNGVNFATSTLTLTGATTPVTTLNFLTVAGPTITAASAVVTTDFYVCRVGSATFTGSASATRSWSLGVDGNAKFGGGITIHCTDVNAAGPYVILATDFLLGVRYTTTASINLNLPAISVVGDGHVVGAVDSGYNAAVNPIAWVPSGADKVNNVAGNYSQNVTGSTIWLRSNSTTSNWEII